MSWSEAGQEHARHVMENTVRCVRVSYPSNLTITVQFDRYLASRQQEEPQPGTGIAHDAVSKVETPPSLFGASRLNRARMVGAARDAKKGLDPRAELKLYLDEPLYEGSLSPTGWWKVSPHIYNQKLLKLKTE